MLEANASPRTASTGGALRERWRPQLMLLLPALAAVMAVASLSIALRSQERMIGKPLTDDSYYSLSVAENVADGHNVTIDGTHLTNGFQPLFTFATVPAFMVTDSKAAAIRIVTVMEWLLFVATAALLGLIAVSAWGGEEREERRWIFWTLASLYLAATYALLNHFNGLETGCVLFFYALTWWLYQRGIARTLPGCVALGAVLGLTVLTRIDAAFLVAAVVAVQLLAPGKGALPQRAARAVAIGASAVVVSLPWWIYNVAEFGSLMPSSGTAEQDISIAPTRFPQLIFGAFKVAAPWLSLGARDHNRPAELVRILIVVGIIALLWLQRGALREAIRRAGEDTPLRRHLEFGAAIAVTMAALAVWYLETSGATWFYGRYLAPVSLLAVMALGYGLWQLAKTQYLVTLAVCGGLMLIALVFGVGAQHGGRNYPLADQVALVADSVPPDETVAAGQTGALGFFRSHVVNLDGKVNDDALAYQDHMWEYLRQNNIRWFADESDYFHYLGSDPAATGWRVVGTRGTFTLFHYEGANTRAGE